ncbi:MAG: hypothetical protein JNG89_19165 [Planctomycetaceae bacterium]|nr:hypothetical protein [Planctomycetaceae bacterium]
MALYSLRFAHAGNLRLNQPLRGAGSLTDAARCIAEDAPARAWERLVAACIEHDVDFLLLTPRTLPGTTLIDDRRALLAGFRRLADSSIPVFWALEDGEPPDVFAYEEWPGNVTMLSDRQPTAALSCDGRVLAELTLGGAGHETAGDRPDVLALPGDQPLRILVPDHPDAFDQMSEPENGGNSSGQVSTAACHDYIACWGASHRQSRSVGITLVADPGPPQGRSVDETGGGGIDIVDWHAGRIADIVRVPTASVRWERCPLVVTPETSRAELIERLQFMLIEREPAIGESLWLLRWRITGSGPCIELLSDPALCREIEQAVESAFGDSPRLTRVHRWEVCPREAAATDSASTMLQAWLTENAETAWPAVKQEVEAELNRARIAPFADGLSQLPAGAVREAAELLRAGWLANSVRDAG